MAFWMVGKTVQVFIAGVGVRSGGINADVDVLGMGEGGEESYSEEDG